MRVSRIMKGCIAAALIALSLTLGSMGALAADKKQQDLASEYRNNGGGFAVTGQLGDVGYMAEIYNASNGLPTSEANCVLGASDGHIWIGGYAGVLRYDGSTFERLPSSTGLTNARAIYEDIRGRIWVGTNDNGIVVIDGEEYTHFTKKDGLRSSSVRSFAEDLYGNVYVGTTAGMVYVDTSMKLHVTDDKRINNERVLRLVSDTFGNVYGQTKSGAIFRVSEDKLISYYTSRDLGIEGITTILADSKKAGKIYIGTGSNYVYSGNFGDPGEKMKRYYVAPAENIHWMSYDCDRVWISSDSVVGYIDGFGDFKAVENLPMDDAIEMMTSDYQGNMWFASSREGVMKIVVNNFQNYSAAAGIADDVVNSTLLHGDDLYLGTDDGLKIIGRFKNTVENELTDYIGKNRVRHIMRDSKENLWISTYTGGLGLVRYGKDGSIKSFTTDDGMPGDETRCAIETSDGRIVSGTSEGIAVIRDGKVVDTIGAEQGLREKVILTVCEGENGEIYAGSDGDGLYVIDESGVRYFDKELTSDVIMRIRRDEKHDLYWIITSNAIEYLKDGEVKNLTTFPYNNVFDIFCDSRDNFWVMTSQGIYCVDSESMLSDRIVDYRLYTMLNGVTSIPVVHSYSFLDDGGNLYIAGGTGVSKVNLDRFYESNTATKAQVAGITFEGKNIKPDESGTYVIPAGDGRLQITPAVLDYTLSNPTVQVYLEGSADPGISAPRDKVTTLEYTALAYGNYILHIRVLGNDKKSVISEETFNLIKRPHFFELVAVRLILVTLLTVAAGIIVWRILDGTVIRRQYQLIQDARNEAENANMAKSRFLANMSHEIRTPINTILGMDEMIIREDAKNVPDNYYQSVLGYAHDIRGATEALLGLINDLLDISKIESGKMHLVEQEYDVTEMFRAVIKMIRVRSEAKKLWFDVDIDETLPARLYGDEGKIRQIILNLLTNAVKYTDEGGFTLKARVIKKDELSCSLRISVKDTGIGVKKEDLDRLFNAYERLDEEKNSAIQGTGLGLDISRQFATLMNGRLWCESEYGEGSEFILTISQKIIERQEIGVFHEEEDVSSRGPYVPKFIAPEADILVVDDNPMNLNVIKGLLKPTRMFITTAESGEECLEKLKTGSFNVVLLDHMMPGMDGIETLGQIRKKYGDIPVYALTANGTAGEEFYKSKGFNGYLSKPIDTVQVERAIMRHLPESIMMKPKESREEIQSDTLPENLSWLYETEGISADEGIKACGGVDAYIGSLKLFLDTLEESADVIEGAYRDGDIRLFTVKVHALKSSARIIGAKEFSLRCQKMEDAGNAGDMEYINRSADELLKDFRAYGPRLIRLVRDEEEAGKDLPKVPPEMLLDAYEALKELVPAMEYDGVEMVLSQLKEYALDENDASKIKELEKSLRVYDWEEMENILGLG